MGVTYKQGKIMKNIYKSFALLCMGLAATACIEENFENNGPKYDTTPGNEIVFSATAGIESGDKKTRTVYGDQDDPTAAKGWIEINWVDDDMIAITSPQSGGPKVGHYKVKGGTHQKNEGEDVTNPDYNKTHAAASLTRLGDGGLQWSEETKYTFYAAYPSFKYDVDKSHGATATLTEDGVLTGSMPIDQNYTLTGNSTDGWVAAPDMRYSFMTASSTYNTVNEDGTANEEAINLEFKSMVTALQFDLKAGTIDTKDPVTGYDVEAMEIISVSLSSNKNITGGFNYDIKDGSYVSENGTRLASLHFDEEELMLYSSNSLNVTFFILPETFPTANDELKLQVNFKLGSTQMSRIATIRAENIKGGKKYIFNNVTLPSFKNDVDVSASSWWDTLDPNTILSQVSIPVASNVFANTQYGVSNQYNQQQSLEIEKLWAMGVRGFEIANQSMVSAWGTADSEGPEWKDVLAGNLDEEPVIAAENELSETFKSSIDKLFRLMWGLEPEATTIPDKSKTPTECIVLICTYASKNDGYNPYSYVANLFNSLTNFCDRWKVAADETFVQITKNSTVGDLAGKIAVIIRPGDDERWLYENGKLAQGSPGIFGILGTPYTPQTDPLSTLGIEDATNGLTALINNNTLESDWWNRVLLISDWGTAYDVWDRRYGSNFAREASFNDIAVDRDLADPKDQYESYLWATSQNGFGSNSVKQNFNFEHVMSNGATAHVQEWMRVIPEGGITASVTSGRNTVYFSWPESITEKKTAIKTLFEESVKMKGQYNDDLYINVLTGYYATTSHAVSYYPFKDSFGSVNLSGQGKGGDFAGLAEDLNAYTYELLSAEPEKDGLSDEGPWGLVMIDHIKADDVSADLVELIMMNNFKFPLVTKDGVTKTTYNATYSNGGEAISFK